MNKEQCFLLDCLKAYLNGTSINDEYEINCDSLFSLAMAHNLAPVVFSVARNNPVLLGCKKSYEAFKDAFYDAIVCYDMQKDAISEIDGFLTDNGIDHVFFKGSQLKEYFPAPELRLMSDIDLLIRLEDRIRAKTAFLKNGYTITEDNGPVYNYKKGEILVECHTKIVSGKVGNANAEEFFEDAINHATFENHRGTLDVQYNLMYLLTHIAHHFWFYGAGAKMILDLAVIIKRFNPSIDAVVDNMKDLHLDEFARVIFTVCYDWFNVGKAYDCDTDKAKEFLISHGAFGNTNRSIAAVVKRKALEEGHTSTLATRLSLLFPSYKKMKNIPYVKFIEGRPYLLAFGWIYRIIYNLKNKKAFVKEATSTLANDETEAEAKKEIEFFEEIGLL